jgi:hypothetical protein
MQSKLICRPSGKRRAELRGFDEEDWYHSFHISQAASEGRTARISMANTPTKIFIAGNPLGE